jgi:hypothetical protein
MSDPTRIPTRSREIVARRSDGRCERCGGPGSDWHHRRRRRIVEHRHCPCNGVRLCSTCHRWAHANPEAARASGFIVPSHLRPQDVPIRAHGMWWRHDCDGDFDDVDEADLVVAEGGPVLRTLDYGT